MHPVEVQQVLDSMEILVDTREQNTKRAERRYASFGLPYSRATLNYGDYTWQATLPNGKKIHDTSEAVHGRCVVERKMDLDELAQCFTRSRKRFEAEFQRAQDNGARVYLLTESGSWEKILSGSYMCRFNSKAFVGSVTAFMVRYNANIVFCREEASGRIIKEILYRDLKERLEKGEFDE